MLLFGSAARQELEQPDGTWTLPSTAASRLLDGDVKSTGQAAHGDAGSAEWSGRTVACWCVQDEGERPSMGTVVQALEGLVDVNAACPENAQSARGEQLTASFSGVPSTEIRSVRLTVAALALSSTGMTSCHAC
ncbi:hypothetical protein ZWY2020_046897 [Hordeum vulgare]|nr:hypothetical protein ZWY2020_046897 [Hordeum vulgare]